MNEMAELEADTLLSEALQAEEEIGTPYTAKEAWNAIWRHIEPIKKQIFLLAIFGVVSAILNGLIPYVTGQFFDALISLANNDVSAWNNFPMWGVLLFLWFAIQLTTNIVDWAMSYRLEKMWLWLRMNIESSSFSHLLTLPVAFHKSTHMGGTVNVISNAGWRMSATVRYITEITPQFLSLLIGITLAFSINSTLAGILFCGVLIYAVILYFMLRNIAVRDNHAQRAWNTAWDYATQKANGAEIVKQAGGEKYESAKIKRLHLKHVFEFWNKLEIHWSNVRFFQRVVVFITQLSVFIFSIHLIREHIITVGELVAVNGYALMLFGPLVQLGHSWQTMQNGVTSAVHLAKLLDTKPEIYTPKDAVTPHSITGAIHFQDVAFRYEEDQPFVLTNLTAEIVPGSVVALVGESGGGKSTTIGLVSAYYFPTSGSVLIDGIDTHSYDLHALRSHIAIVPQEVTLWNDTIKNNIRYGSFGSSDEDILRVVKESHLLEFVTSLPKGLESLVGERGVKLSVGQKQRVAIARAMLRNPAILILDEPTSALDAQTETYVTEALERLMKGRTTLIIAHRLSTVRRADNILVFDKGKIAESGTHEELLKKDDGVYSNLYRHQIGFHE